MNELMKLMSSIQYGFKDEKGQIISNENFPNFYRLQTPEELLKSKCGICWDQVELERAFLEKKKIKVKTYFIYVVDNENLPSHTFLSFESNNKYYWFEHSWEKYQGIHEYDREIDLLLDVKKLFIKEYNENDLVFIYEYQKPKAHLTCDEFYQYIETQKLIKTNKPLYFYHLVDKNTDLSKGLFPNNENYLYFYKYVPLKINELTNIYRININDEELQKLMLDIFYGINSDNQLLDKKYYENVSKEEYFAKSKNFKTLNQIGISFKDGYCPLKFLEKVEWRNL